MSWHCARSPSPQPVLALEPGVALVDKPFSEAALLAKAGRVLDGYFRRYEPIGGATPSEG